jgi:hypothetical protein
VPRRRGAGVVAGALAVATLAAAALLVDLGRIHALEHGDSLVPVLVSLQRWTPMYWSQERYGMLVPLLALPVRDPLLNLLLQRGLLVLSGLAAVLLLARYVFGAGGGRAWLLTGLFGAAAIFLLPREPWLFEYLGDQPYGLSAALGLLGLLAVAAPGRRGRRGPGRVLLGLLLVLAAHWVNAAAGLFLGPLAVARAAADRLVGRPGARGRLRLELLLLAAGLALGQAIIWLWPRWSGQPLRLETGVFPPSAWPALFQRLLASAREGAGPLWVAALAAAGALGLALPWRRADDEAAVSPRLAALLRAALLVLGALASAVPVAALRWVSANAFHPRYVALQLLVVHLSLLSLLAEPLWRSGRARLPALAAALVLVPVAAVAAFGLPSLAQVRADLDGRAGRWTEDVLAARCDLVTGDYWSVWPAVWHAGWVAAQRGVPAPYGLCYRTTPTQRFWAARPPGELRICAVKGEDAEVERWLRAFRLWPVRTLEERLTVRVVQPVGLAQ